MELLIEYVLEDKPLSVNSAFNYNPKIHRRFFSEAHSRQRNQIQLELLKAQDKFKEHRQKPLRVEIDWYAPTFFNKNSTIKVKDLSGIVKQLEDAILPVLGLDDSQVFESTQRKIADTKEFVVIKIYLLQ